MKNNNKHNLTKEVAIMVFSYIAFPDVRDGDQIYWRPRATVRIHVWQDSAVVYVILYTILPHHAQYRAIDRLKRRASGLQKIGALRRRYTAREQRIRTTELNTDSNWMVCLQSLSLSLSLSQTCSSVVEKGVNLCWAIYITGLYPGTAVFNGTTTVPQLPWFYRTLLAHDKQSNNAQFAPFERSVSGVCYATKRYNDAKRNKHV